MKGTHRESVLTDCGLHTLSIWRKIHKLLLFYYNFMPPKRNTKFGNKIFHTEAQWLGTIYHRTKKVLNPSSVLKVNLK